MENSKEKRDSTINVNALSDGSYNSSSGWVLINESFASNFDISCVSSSLHSRKCCLSLGSTDEEDI